MRSMLKTLAAFLLVASLAADARLKDLANIEGVRENQLIGYSLAAGLAGTGYRQQTVFSNQSLTNILARMGITVSPTAIRVKNTAAVTVTANAAGVRAAGDAHRCHRCSHRRSAGWNSVADLHDR